MQPKHNLEHWLTNQSFGKYLLAKESIFYHKSIANIFGYYALQLNPTNIDFMGSSKINNKFKLDIDIKSIPQALPFASNSIDLIICAHTLELQTNYLAILSECQRILAHQGKLIITNFNPNSCLYLFKNKYPSLKDLNFIKSSQLQDEITSLQLQICAGEFISYKPPFLNHTNNKEHSYIEKIGNRWLPTFANIYSVVCTKLVTPVTPILNTSGLATDTPQELNPTLGTTTCKNQL